MIKRLNLRERIERKSRRLPRSVTQRKKELIFKLESCVQDHEEMADPRIIEALKLLISVVCSNEIAFPGVDLREKIFDRISILNQIVQIFDPVLKELLPSVSALSIALGQSFTLHSHLNGRKDLRSLADKLRRVANSLDSSIDENVAQWEALCIHGNSLVAISDIFEIVLEYLPRESLNWCRLCFRRAELNRLYCTEHTAGEFAGKDTANQKAKRLYKILPDEIFFEWKTYTSSRMAIGDEVDLITDISDIQITDATQAVLIAPGMKRLVVRTVSLPWLMVAKDWSSFISTLPTLSKIMVRNPVEFSSWKEFSAYGLKVVNDTIETTEHPYWVMKIFWVADNWLAFVEKNKDARNTDTYIEILELARNGLLKPKEISVRLGISREYVYRILKTHRT